MRANPFLPLIAGMPLPFGGLLRAVPLAERLGLEHLTASAGRDIPGYCQTHRYPAWTVVGTLAGRGRIESGPLVCETVPGTVYVIPPEQAFHETSCGTGRWTWVVILAYLAPGSPLTDGLPQRPAAFRADYGFFERLARLPVLLHRQEPGDALTAMGTLLEICGACIRQARSPRTGAGDGLDPLVTRATALMRERLGEAVTLTELARQCGVSLSSCSHRFKQATGLTPMRWFQREKIRAARRLLLDGRSVAEAGDELGFANPFHFSRVFRQFEGVPPRLFQKLSRTP